MIAGILLAAGESRRFGSPKLLHRLPDRTPLGLQSALNLAAAVERTIAVVPPEAQALTEVLSRAPIEICVCAQSRDGMGASLACGVRATPDADGWIIALADMPFIQPATISAVAQALRDGAPIAAPLYDGRRGHPVGIGRDYYAELAALTGDVGARTILSRDAPKIVLLPTSDRGVHQDIDTLGDLSA